MTSEQKMTDIQDELTRNKALLSDLAYLISEWQKKLRLVKENLKKSLNRNEEKKQNLVELKNAFEKTVYLIWSSTS